MVNYLWFFLAAFFEIAGCFAFWMWWRLEKSMLWIFPGLISLAVFALILTRVEIQFAGRTYAAYGGIYIVGSLAWLALIEQTKPIGSDYLGVFLCLAGASVILFGPRLLGN